MESTTKKYRIAVPETLTWDKLCALYVMTVSRLHTTLDNIELIFEDELKGQLVPSGVLDIDVRKKYHELGYGSATDVVATIYSLTDVPGMNHLLAILAKNNGSGYLKDYPQSLVALIRKMYEVAHNVPWHEHRVQVIRLFWPVMETYFATAHKDLDFVEVAEQPFSFRDYELMLHIARAEGSLTRRDNDHLDELLRAFEKAATRDAQATERAQSIVPTEFGVRVQGGGSAQGHLITTDDSRLSAKYFRERQGFVVLVTRTRDGNAAIFVRGDQNLKPLYDELDRREPDIWYLKVPDVPGKSPMILNGSDSKKQPPTQLTDSDLMTIIGRHFIHTPRSQRERDRRRGGRPRPEPSQR